MKKTALIILLALMSHYAQCQSDTLVTVNDYKVPVTITEITAREVIYRLPNKPDMPLFHYARYDLKNIILKDGSTIKPNFKTVNPFDKKEIVKGKTILYFTPTKLFINQIGFSVERIFKGNHFGIRVPISFAYSDPYKIDLQGSVVNSNFDNKRFWSTGIDLNIYPFKLGPFKYVVSTSIQYAEFAYLQSHYIQNIPYYYSNSYYTTKEKGTHFSLILSNGFIAQIGGHFIINTSVGVGYQTEIANSNYSNSNEVRLNAAINIGYKF